jgi:hypothetical protein
MDKTLVGILMEAVVNNYTVEIRNGISGYAVCVKVSKSFWERIDENCCRKYPHYISIVIDILPSDSLRAEEGKFIEAIRYGMSELDKKYSAIEEEAFSNGNETNG